MKRVYGEPTIEKIDFNYREQVVATSGGTGGGLHGRSNGNGPCLNSMPNGSCAG